MRALVFLLSAVSVICVIIHYNYRLGVIKFRNNQVDEDISLYSSGLWKWLIAEICIHMFVCPPNVDITYQMVQLGQPIVYSFDAMTAIISLARLYTVLRLFEHYSHWTNERSKRVCNLHSTLYMYRQDKRSIGELVLRVEGVLDAAALHHPDDRLGGVHLRPGLRPEDLRDRPG